MRGGEGRGAKAGPPHQQSRGPRGSVTRAAASCLHPAAGDCVSPPRFMNHRVPAHKRYQPTEYEHAANCATHAVSLGGLSGTGGAGRQPVALGVSVLIPRW